jgi:hypothetical protein
VIRVAFALRLTGTAAATAVPQAETPSGYRRGNRLRDVAYREIGTHAREHPTSPSVPQADPYAGQQCPLEFRAKRLPTREGVAARKTVLDRGHETGQTMSVTISRAAGLILAEAASEALAGLERVRLMVLFVGAIASPGALGSIIGGGIGLAYRGLERRGVPVKVEMGVYTATGAVFGALFGAVAVVTLLLIG